MERKRNKTEEEEEETVEKRSNKRGKKDSKQEENNTVIISDNEVNVNEQEASSRIEEDEEEEYEEEEDEKKRVENVAAPLTAAEMDKHDRDYFDTIPSGYRFEPTGEELITYYLKNKILNLPLPRNLIRDVNVYSDHPLKLTSMFKLHRGKKWYFFTPRTKKYPNGQRPDRAAGNGYWKATSGDAPIHDNQGVKIGTKKTLVYYEGKAKEKNKTKTDWFMHEYRIADDYANNVDPEAKKDGKELDKYVLCMIYDKSAKEGPDANENQQDGNNMMNVPANNGEYPYQNPNGAGPIIPVQNWQVQSPNTNQGQDGANFYDTSPLLMQNVNVQNDSITQELEGGRFGNMASLRMQNVQVPTHGLDMESGLMHNVQVPNSNIAHGLQNGRFYNIENGPRQNIQARNSNIAHGLQNGRFYNMENGPRQNLQVPNSSIAQALQNGHVYNMAIFPYRGVYDNTASSHIQNNVANHFYDKASLPMSNFDQGKNIYARNGSNFQSWGNGHHLHNNQQGSSADPLEMMQSQNQSSMSQLSDYQSMGNGSEVTPHLDYAPDHNLLLEDLHWALSNHEDEEPLDCKDGQLGGADQSWSSKDKKG